MVPVNPFSICFALQISLAPGTEWGLLLCDPSGNWWTQSSEGLIVSLVLQKTELSSVRSGILPTCSACAWAVENLCMVKVCECPYVTAAITGVCGANSNYICFLADIASYKLLSSNGTGHTAGLFDAHQAPFLGKNRILPFSAYCCT